MVGKIEQRLASRRPEVLGSMSCGKGDPALQGFQGVPGKLDLIGPQL
jgi:hypothetical protein